ncbi:MAG: hypoxanthine phosphoribosyltransferase [Microthrixaceae bacterium]
MTGTPEGTSPATTEGAAPPLLSADPNIGPTLLTAEEIADRVARLGAEITERYSDRPPLLVGVLRGSLVFLTDLVRAIDLPVSIDFIAVSSYGSATRTSGVVRLVKDLEEDLTGRDVILVEDIVDTGLTLRYLRKNLAARGPASLEVCTLLARRSVDVAAQDVEYVGFEIDDDAFVIGYGLDLDQRYRNLSHIAAYVGPAR